jgi:hypothetical protein
VDETIRALEHALATTPDDTTSRLSLAAALGQAGRLSDALDRLDWGRIDAGSFAAARSLADELWSALISRFEPAAELRLGDLDLMHLTVDLTGELAAWCDSSRIVVLSLETGERLLDERAFPKDRWLRPVRRGFFFLDQRRRVVRELSWHGRFAETEVPVALDVNVVGASPAGDLVELTTGVERLRRWHWEDDEPRPSAHQTIHRWPSLEPLVEVEGYSHEIDWDAGAILDATRRSSGRLARFFDGSPPREVPCDGERLHPLGRGVCAEYNHSLVSVRHGWRQDVLRYGGGERSTALDGSIVLSGDGRGLRVFHRGTPIRLDIDLETGAVLGHRQAREKLESGMWHPHADVWVEPLWEGETGPVAVRGFEERILVLPEGARGWPWLFGGRGLLVSREGRAEVWRAR